MKPFTKRQATRKEWLKNLQKRIAEIKDKNEGGEAKESLKAEFRQFESTGEYVIRYVLVFLFALVLLFGLHFGYATLMWEAHIYEFDSLWSPDISMIAFILLGIIWLILFCLFWDFCWDTIAFNKQIYESLEGNFYLHFFRYLLVLLLIGFLLFMIFVFIVSYQIASFHNIPWNDTFLEVLEEIFD